MIPNDIYLKMIEDIEDYAILLLDKDGNIESWNKGAEKIKGYKREEIIGKNFSIFYTEEDQKNGLPRQLIQKATMHGKAIYEGWRVRKDGTKFWGNIVATALYDNEGELIGFSKVTRDLTGKKLAEEMLLQFNRELEKKVKEKSTELYKNEKRFRALVENNYEAISLRDAKGTVVYQSPGSERLSGYTIEEVNNIGSVNIFHPDDVDGIAERINTSLQHPGKPVYGTHRIRHKSGHYLWVEGSYTNMLDDENVAAIVSNFRDITERKHAEEKTIQANRLYAFVSAINQTIVHVQDEQTLYDEACRIAIDIGKFETAWISIPDETTRRLNIVAHNNVAAADMEFLSGVLYNEHSAKGKALQKGKYYLINDIQNEPVKTVTQEYAISRGFQSYIALPIRKSGVTIGSYNLNALQSNFFDEQEIKLLREVVGDISFAIDNFENEKRRKLTEEKIRHNELRLQQAQAIAHFGSWEMNLATGIGIWSEEFCRIYGLAPDDNIQSYKQWLSFIHPEDIGYVIKTTKENEQKMRGSAFFHRIVRRDGTVRYVYSQAEIEIKNEVAIGLYGVVHDITNMKEAEDALKQSRTNLRLIIDLIPQSVFVKNYYGEFIFVNKTFAALYGLSPEQLINKKIRDTLPESNDPDFFIKQDQEIINTGITKIIPEEIFTDHEGAERVFYTIKVPYVLPGTNERAVLGIAQDITDQKRVEAERTKMISDIVQRNKDLEQFSYIVSHNLRAPVANIIGLTDLFRIMKHDAGEEKIMMGELSVTAGKLDSVIKDLNHILQIRNQVSENRELVRFSALVSDIETSISGLLKNEDVKIIADFAAADEMFSIKSYLYSIFFNLISNSIKYRQHGVQSIIQITSGRDENGITLTFKDNGLGIDLKRRGTYVFGLYKRFHDHVEGKGVGLYMVKAQVETLGGKISVESEVNKGTTFTLVFGNQ